MNENKSCLVRSLCYPRLLSRLSWIMNERVIFYEDDIAIVPCVLSLVLNTSVRRVRPVGLEWRLESDPVGIEAQET